MHAQIHTGDLSLHVSYFPRSLIPPSTHLHWLEEIENLFITFIFSLSHFILLPFPQLIVLLIPKYISTYFCTFNTSRNIEKLYFNSGTKMCYIYMRERELRIIYYWFWLFENYIAQWKHMRRAQKLVLILGGIDSQ